ncbi:MAG: hypothetical protein HFE76_00020 [Firmicutes bacterium]|nr:hypothetical protein [Bacillota bacterium]
MYEFSVYGINFEHEENWVIHIDPIKAFEPDNGSVKVEYMNQEKQTSEASMRVTWTKAPEGISSFAEHYFNQLDKQYKKTIKNANRYKFLRKELIRHNGHQACLSHIALNTSTHFIRPIGKSVNLELLELALLCEDSNRIIVATLSATMDYFQGNETQLEQLLFSLKCHK